MEQIDLRLRPDSPAVDAGSTYDNIPETDVAGHPRIVGKSIDIGAYEYQGPSGPQGTVVPVN